MIDTQDAGDLPDAALNWRGTAAALADQCNALAPHMGLAEEAGAANERLVRHYVQVGVLSPPEREGREALFDARHIREFLAARYLLKDGWSLAKITELVRAAGPQGLARFLPTVQGPTDAERTLARLKSYSIPPSTKPQEHDLASESASTANLPMLPVPNMLRSLSDPLQHAAQIADRRRNLHASLTALGNASGQPERSRRIRIVLTPWCEVYLDPAELERRPVDTPTWLGTALTHALHEDRLRRGGKS